MESVFTYGVDFDKGRTPIMLQLAWVAQCVISFLLFVVTVAAPPTGSFNDWFTPAWITVVGGTLYLLIRLTIDNKVSTALRSMDDKFEQSLDSAQNKFDVALGAMQNKFDSALNMLDTKFMHKDLANEKLDRLHTDSVNLDRDVAKVNADLHTLNTYTHAQIHEMRNKMATMIFVAEQVNKIEKDVDMARREMDGLHQIVAHAIEEMKEQTKSGDKQ